MNFFTVIIASFAFLDAALAYGYGGYGITYGEGGGEEVYGPSNYKFDYGVHDPHTGDNKQQHEIRHGDVVKGAYSFKEADGTTRVVEYEAGPHSGFNAVVRRIGHAYHPAVYGGAGGHGPAYGALGYHGHGGGYGPAVYGTANSYVGPTNFGYKYY